jgi:hypothetical protein
LAAGVKREEMNKRRGKHDYKKIKILTIAVEKRAHTLAAPRRRLPHLTPAVAGKPQLQHNNRRPQPSSSAVFLLMFVCLIKMKRLILIYRKSSN